MMTSTQIQLIRETFALIGSQADVAALVFYRRLFELDPALRPLFRENIEEQGRKLMQMLTAAVRLLEKPQALVPVLEDLGRRHVVRYGVRDEHYDTVGEALLWMLAQMLGKEFTAPALDAWASLYSVVATTMKRAAAEAPHVTPGATHRCEIAAAAR
jgi:hemoglobin-like flavoprotein